jgi:hypothetical protein
MINLDDKKYEVKDVKIFNGGNAGIVKECNVRIERRGADEDTKLPLYKLVFTDNTKAELNDSIFNNFDNMSEKALEFFVRKMKHLAKVFRVDDKLPARVASYDELLDITMRLCHKNSSNIKVNLAVCYGTKAKPSRYLMVDGFWGIQNAEDTIPVLSKNALLERPEADDDNPVVAAGKSSGGSNATGSDSSIDDLPFSEGADADW